MELNIQNLALCDDTAAGFRLARAVFTPHEIDQIGEHLGDAGIRRSRAGARHLYSVPRLRDLAHDVRLFEIAGAFLRAAPQPYRVTLFEKSPRANWLVVWHQDTALPLCWRFDRPGWGPWSNKAGICYAHAPAAALSRIIALRIHLDDSLASNGPLRVIPGSHRLGIVDDAQIASIVHRSTAVECTIPKDGVVAMRPLIIHASSKTQSDVARRVLHIEYADALDLAPGIRLARA